MRRLEMRGRSSCASLWLGRLRDLGARHGARSGPTGRGRRRPPRAARSSPAPGRRRRAGGYVLPPIRRSRAFPPSPGVDAAKVYSLPRTDRPAEIEQSSTRIAWNDARRAALAAGIAESAYLPKDQRERRRRIPGEQRPRHGRWASTWPAPARPHGEISAVSLNGCCSISASARPSSRRRSRRSVISNVAFTAAHQQVIYDVSLCLLRARGRAGAVSRRRRSRSHNAQAVQAAAGALPSIGVRNGRRGRPDPPGTAQANLGLVSGRPAGRRTPIWR